MTERISAAAAAGLIAALAGLAVLSTARAQGVVGEWSQVQVAPPPELHQVTVDPNRTALLVMDFGLGYCGQEPRCVAAVPHIKSLLDQARSHNVLVVYSGFPNLSILSEIAPQRGEPMVDSGPDKFRNTNLDEILKRHGITTVIACGTAPYGAELATATGATQRGYHVIVPVDCMPGRDAFSELVVVYAMANFPGLAPPRAGRGAPPGGGGPGGGGTQGAGGPPGAGARGGGRAPGLGGGPPPGFVTLTSVDMIHFGS